MASTIGEKIQGMRQSGGLSRSELAKLLSVPRGCVRRWESDVSVPDIESFVRICLLFGVSADCLLKDAIPYNRAAKRKRLLAWLIPVAIILLAELIFPAAPKFENASPSTPASDHAAVIETTSQPDLSGKDASVYALSDVLSDPDKYNGYYIRVDGYVSSCTVVNGYISSVDLYLVGEPDDVVSSDIIQITPKEMMMAADVYSDMPENVKEFRDVVNAETKRNIEGGSIKVTPKSPEEAQFAPGAHVVVYGRFFATQYQDDSLEGEEDSYIRMTDCKISSAD